MVDAPGPRGPTDQDASVPVFAVTAGQSGRAKKKQSKEPRSDFTTCGTNEPRHHLVLCSKGAAAVKKEAGPQLACGTKELRLELFTSGAAAVRGGGTADGFKKEAEPRGGGGAFSGGDGAFGGGGGDGAVATNQAQAAVVEVEVQRPISRSSNRNATHRSRSNNA